MIYIVIRIFYFLRNIYNNRYGLFHTWPMMPGGHTLTVRELEALQLKYKAQEKNRVIKHGDSTIQRSIDQADAD